MFLLILPDIFRSYAGRYGEHYCKFDGKTNKYEKSYCVLRSKRLHLGEWFPTFLALQHPTKEKYNLWHLVANP